MRFPLYIARRYLFTRKSQNAINIISGISMLGVAVGAMALVVILSVFNGFDEVVKSLFNSFDPDIRITATQGKVFTPDERFQQVRKLEGVAYFSEVLEENALLKYDERQHIATIKGVDASFINVTGIDSMVYEGEMILKDNNRSYAVVGQGVAYNLQIGLNFINPLFVYMPKRVGRINLANPDDAFRRQYIFPGAIFAIEQDYDSKYVIVPIEFMRELLDYTSEASAVELKLDPAYNVAETQDRISEILGEGFLVQNRTQQNELFYKVMRSEKWAIFLILTFILVIASFNIIGSLSMLIIDKKNDIRSLRNMGASQKLIGRIFLLEGWLISITGSVIGIVLGTLISWLQDRFELLKLSGSGTFVIDAYPVDLQLGDVLLVWITVLVIGFLAALYPVRQISKKYLSELEGRESGQ
ncbi:MAG: FtsX-like permease family protein [Bacteroidales bacterium]|nr:FtsX-like permease family protein [Bacteroidales bacterium]MDT8430635.1 FtsX-like permease family protein [Bacteroidales bacterium]